MAWGTLAGGSPMPLWAAFVFRVRLFSLARGVFGAALRKSYAVAFLMRQNGVQ